MNWKNKNSKQNAFVVLASLLFTINLFAQPTIIEPGDKNVDASLINKGTFTWGWFKDGQTDLGFKKVKVQYSNQKLFFITHRNNRKQAIYETDSLVLDATTLKPVYRNYRGEEVSYYMQYGSTIKGARTILETNKKENLSEPFNGKYFDLLTLPLIISCLPLSPGYQATIPVVDYNSEFKPVFYTFKITEVAEKKTISERSGVHDVWKVTVYERKRGDEYILYIDKYSRRILRMDFSIVSAIITYNYIDRELDVNPIKAPFNEEETMAMITKGSAGIKGQAYFKGYGKKFNDSRDKKKQYAEKGSIVMLIPNTPYFKEWAEYNLKLAKLAGPSYTVDWGGMMGQTGEKDRTTIGTSYPLPSEVEKCMLLTTVSDDKGNFVFQNLKPGEYLLYVTYTANKYSSSTKEYKGTQATWNADGTLIATPIWDVKDWTMKNNVKAHKYLTIKKEGEIVDVVIND